MDDKKNEKDSQQNRDALIESLFGELTFEDVLVPEEKAATAESASKASTPAPQAPAPQAPASHASVPASHASAPASHASTPASHASAPASHASAPASHASTPASHASTPASQAPTPASQAPTPSASVPAPHTTERTSDATITAAAVRDTTPSHGGKKGSGVKDEKKRQRREPGRGTALPSVLKAVIYIVSVLVVSLFLSYLIISWANDIFAFVKDDTVSTVEITEYMTLDDVATLLYDNGMIRHPSVFKMYVRFKNIELDFVPGTYEISPQLNYEEFIDVFNNFQSKREREQAIITIPEGYTVDDIIDLFVSKGIGSRDRFVEIINQYEFDGEEFRFLAEQPDPLPQGRKYRLEGYLFPDTYYFFLDDKEEAVIYKLLQNTEQKLTDARYDRAAELGYSMDEIITLGSIIQAEGRYANEFENISSVFHNRLHQAETYPYLQSDATVQYVLTEHTVDLTAQDMQTDSPYNTYLYRGLPPGAICNPGLNAIDAALYPAETDYFYFVADAEGVSTFSRTKAEHDAAVAQIRDAAGN